MKDIARRIFEKENHAEVSNNIEKRPPNKSFTQLVSLTLMNNERLLRQPKIEYKSIDFKNSNSTHANPLTQRPLNIQKPSFHNRPEIKQKTTTNASSLRAYSPLQRQNTSMSVYNKQSTPTTLQNQQSLELQKLLNNYSNDILTHYIDNDQSTSPASFLENHTISTNLRAKMVDWMVEVLTSYKCKDQTFFLSTRLMDLYLQKVNKGQSPQDLHLIGVTCMFIACKFEEIYPVKLQVVHEKIAHKKLSKDDIREKESQIAQTLEFKFVGVTLLDLVTMTLSMLNMTSSLQQSAVYLAKMALYEYDFISQNNYAQVAGAAMIVASKIVEQVDQNLESDSIIPKIIQTLQLKEDEAMLAANQLLKIAKNFEKQFPNLENLKKFNKFSLSDALKNNKTDCKL